MHWHYLFMPSLLAALGLPLLVIAGTCQAPITKPSGGKMAAAWYEGWAADVITPDMIPFNLLNTIIFAFASTSNDCTKLILDPVSQSAMPKVVTAAHSNGVPIFLSAGGAGGSGWFSTCVNPLNMTKFVKAVVDMVIENDFDGVEIDWEFPNQVEECNTFSPNDTKNYLAFLQALRKALGKGKTITAAVGVVPWTGPDGTPLTDVSDYADELDYISIMNYDVFGSWSNSTGPNSPLYDACAPQIDQVASATSALKAWTDAKFPVKQISLGVASYGHSFYVTHADAFTKSGALALYAPIDKSKQPLGPGDPLPGSTPVPDQCGNPITAGGVFSFSDLVSQGYLTASGNNASGVDYFFDSCTMTPYLYNLMNDTMITFDNVQSFIDKGKFVVENDLWGFSMWFIGGDYKNLLLNGIRKGMGLST